MIPAIGDSSREILLGMRSQNICSSNGAAYSIEWYSESVKPTPTAISYVSGWLLHHGVSRSGGMVTNASFSGDGRQVSPSLRLCPPIRCWIG